MFIYHYSDTSGVRERNRRKSQKCCARLDDIVGVILGVCVCVCALICLQIEWLQQFVRPRKTCSLVKLKREKKNKHFGHAKSDTFTVIGVFVSNEQMPNCEHEHGTFDPNNKTPELLTHTEIQFNYFSASWLSKAMQRSPQTIKH